jgi:MFS family permease
MGLYEQKTGLTKCKCEFTFTLWRIAQDPLPARSSMATSVTTAIPASPEAVKTSHPLALPIFRNLWIGSTISLLGDQFYLVALPWLVLQLTGSSLALGTVLMTAAVPRAALMLVGGAMTDRFSPRGVLLFTAAARTFLVGCVASLVGLHAIHAWHLYVLTFMFGVADAFSFPAGAALLPTVLQPEQLRPANAFMQSSTLATQMIGPAPAGLAIRRWGIATVLFLDAASFLAVILALVRIPRPVPATQTVAARARRPGMWRSIAEGLQAVRKDHALLALMAISATVNICVSGPIGVGLASIAKFRFGSAAAFGTFLSCFSGGTLAGLMLGGLIKKPRRRGLQFIGVSAFAGLALIGIGAVLKFAVIAVLLALMGLVVGFVNVQFSTWMQTRVPRELLGRVMSVLMFAAVGLIPVSYALSGVVAGWSVSGLLVGAGGLLVLASSGALFSRAARQID